MRVIIPKGTWRNGSAMDFGSIGWGFESLCARFLLIDFVLIRVFVNSLIMYFYVGAFLVLIVLVFYFLGSKAVSEEGRELTNVIIFGLSDSRKTELFYRVTEGVDV